MRHRRMRSPSGRRSLEVQDAIASLAAYELSALELLKQRRTDARAARTARIVDHACHRDVLALFENLMKLALQPLGKLSFDGRRPLFELRRFRAEIAERMLPGIMGLIPARFQIGAAHASLIEIALQRFDLAHRLQISVLELLDLLACGIDFFPR